MESDSESEQRQYLLQGRSDEGSRGESHATSSPSSKGDGLLPNVLSIPGLRPTPSMECLRGSKFAQVLGFGTYNRGDGSPVNLGNMDIQHVLNNGDDGEESSTSTSTNPNIFAGGAAPLEPSFYQMGLGVNALLPNSQWSMNYQEAAIYLEEGSNNDQFSTHPRRKESLPAYILTHSSWYYLLDMLAALLLISLAAVEPPTLPTFQVPIIVHASLELGALSIISFGLFLKLRWLGIKTIFTHHRTTIKAIALLVMIIEAFFVLGRQSSHFRVTRALRPIFLVDNRYFRGVRRFSREVLQSLPPILDMLILLFFLIFVFTLLGHFLFGHDPDDPFFNTVDDSFVNLFVLLTTANYPDVMMPAYNRNRWTVFFFVAYLVSVLYLFMNLLLAVVYDTFTTLEKDKFRKLVIHKRKACHFAFNLLVSKSNTNGVTFRHFYGMMTHYQPKKSLRDIYLTFRALDKLSDGVLSREEFSRLFEVSGYKWKALRIVRFQRQWTFFRKFGSYAQRFLNSKVSDHVFNTVIVLNTAAMLARWIDGQTDQQSWDAVLFAIWFMCEMFLKIITWNLSRIFSSGWHSFDLAASIGLVFSLLLAFFIPSWDELLTFVRPLRLVRIFKMKKRYRNVFGTLFILLPPMSSAAMVILLLYYTFAIIGMEIFNGIPLRNCCNGTVFESYYAEGASNTSFAMRYYINTFDNVFSSLVTLFELTVVNNWYVIMEGHAFVTSKFSRIYFIIFYLVMMVNLTIVLAFILDSFLFRMEYKRKMDKLTEQRLLREEINLSEEELNFCYNQNSTDSYTRLQILQDFGEDLAARGYVTYIGWRKRTKEILFRRLFRNEIPDWLRESEAVLAINH